MTTARSATLHSSGTGLQTHRAPRTRSFAVRSTPATTSPAAQAAFDAAAAAPPAVSRTAAASTAGVA